MVSVVCYVCVVVESNIVIGLYVLDMWSVLFVIYYFRSHHPHSDRTVRTDTWSVYSPISIVLFGRF